jgi:hypothetical protein
MWRWRRSQRAGNTGGEISAGRIRQGDWPASKRSVKTKQNSSQSQGPGTSDISSIEPVLDAIAHRYTSDLAESDAGWPDVDTHQSTCADLAHHLVLNNQLLQQREHYQKHCERIQTDSSQLGICANPSGSSTCAKFTMSTPVLDRFLRSVAELVANRDGAKLQDFLQIEPPLPDIYGQMIMELKTKYPSGEGEAELLRRCEALVPKTKGTSWTAFPVFMKLYFAFLRDVNVENLLETYNRLKALLK